MKRTLIILVGLLAIMIIFFALRGEFTVRNRDAEQKKSADVHSPYVQVICHETDQFLVVEATKEDTAGNDLLIRKKGEGASDECRYEPGVGDIVIANNDANYFLSFAGEYLVVDSGTAPSPRVLSVYDMNTGVKVFTDSYVAPVSSTGDEITYKTMISMNPSERVCPDTIENEKKGLGTAEIASTTVVLQTLVKTVSPEHECVTTQ